MKADRIEGTVLTNRHAAADEARAQHQYAGMPISGLVTHAL